MAINNTLKEISHMWVRGYFLLKMSESTSFKMLKVFRCDLFKRKKKKSLPQALLFLMKCSTWQSFKHNFLQLCHISPVKVFLHRPREYSAFFILHAVFIDIRLKFFLSFFPLRSYVRTGGPSHVNCTSTSCKAAVSVQRASGTSQNVLRKRATWNYSTTTSNSEEGKKKDFVLKILFRLM